MPRVQGEVHAGADGDVGAIIAALLPTALSIADSGCALVFSVSGNALLPMEPQNMILCSLHPLSWIDLMLEDITF
jgi:hypothetical protein